MKNKLRIIFIILIAAIAFYWLPSIFFGLPIPRGTKVCADYSSYYKNWNTIKENAWREAYPFNKKRKK